MVAIAIAAATPLGVWWVNGFLPLPAKLLGATLGFSNWAWWSLRGV
ncbi:hypothetical protein M673_07730 [Aureimonas sp. AU20]|nr:hypothetical protein M673_07730 [Aureimonas sp. AU20]